MPPFYINFINLKCKRITGLPYAKADSYNLSFPYFILLCELPVMCCGGMIEQGNG